MSWRAISNNQFRHIWAHDRRPPSPLESFPWEFAHPALHPGWLWSCLSRLQPWQAVAFYPFGQAMRGRIFLGTITSRQERLLEWGWERDVLPMSGSQWDLMDPAFSAYLVVWVLREVHRVWCLSKTEGEYRPWRRRPAPSNGSAWSGEDKSTESFSVALWMKESWCSRTSSMINSAQSPQEFFAVNYTMGSWGGCGKVR